MRYLFVAIGTFLLSAFFIVIRYKTGWVEGFLPNFVEFVLWIPIAFFFANKVLRTTISRVPVGFREIVVIISMVFATISANASIQIMQSKIFGRTWSASYKDPVAKPGSSEVPVVPTVGEKIATNFVSVAGEEIGSRFIIVSALLMVMSPGWAIALSSLLFAALHTVIPILVGMPEIGLFRLGSTGVIGVACGIAFIRYGLGAAIAIHFLVNLVGWFAYNQTYIANAILFGSGFVALFVLPPTLWFTRKRRKHERETLISQAATV
ncbi:CPBP family intramembrane glutamic endopeptidase [Oligoflexus tunisiensis]|uniref:CPBP family intramembrane glutamic endopeptidase n=1 Tax=Oligoflexus tunisiensis TaxID=708132 RepID=UPI00114D1535|nr:CPBP family intramembrane glutamic endopeptidase [Oligoflexus tunisiensis]